MDSTIIRQVAKRSDRETDKEITRTSPITSENLGKRIGDIDEDYPVEIPIPVLFACQIESNIISIRRLGNGLEDI